MQLHTNTSNSNIAMTHNASLSTNKGNCLSVYVSGKPCNEIILDRGGVIGDGHYGEDPERSVMITSTFAYDLAAKNSIEIVSGGLEENILVDMDPYGLPMGARLSIGEAIVEISMYGTICKSLTRIDTRLPKLLKEKRGIFARVIKPGRVAPGDHIEVLTQTPPS